MKNILYIIAFSFIFSCSESKEAQIKHLNGYWEIVEATTNNQTKQYKYNEFIDYFIVNDSLNGFRKKVKPTLQNNFITTKIEEELKVTFKDDKIILNYKTDFNERKETVLKLTETELKVKNDNNQTYLYKKYQPLDLN